MPGKGHRFSAKEDRMALHIEESERSNKSVIDGAETARIAWSTVNKYHTEHKHRRGK